ncbi:hypothetical protein FA13DRAFT_159525 [Coprinellus micaceus]|uniref:Uncharacterized protein n=1 Tax=Coprinellus micaceus TaxID=71717 RepID=A0A4Y7THQ6_COPMI|nr:hypothetical protein FA13DRAFT_159525 [Coprinellus micaceus]
MSNSPVSDATVKRALFVENYPDAFFDTYGVVGGVPFIYKTGPAWPQRRGGPEAQPYLREMRPVSHTHPINASWADIAKKIDAHFMEVGMPLNIVAGLAYGNRGYEETFCELIVVLGLPPTPFEFTRVKAAANYAQETILTDAGFPEIQVAVREWEVNLNCTGPKLPSLNWADPGNIAEFRHPFTSNPGLAVAPLNKESFGGTIGAYFSIGDHRDVVLGLTCCHVASPGHASTGLSVADAAVNHEDIIAIGGGAYEAGIAAITERIGTLQDIIVSEKDTIEWWKQRLDDPDGNPATIAKMRGKAQTRAETAIEAMDALESLHRWIADHLAPREQRHIGRVYCAERIDASSKDPTSAYTVDWAFVQLNQDAFKRPGFTGNQVYIGGMVRMEEYRNLMFPYVADRGGYKYPQNGLLQISGYVPKSEMLNPKQRGPDGEPRMPVIKNGRTTGTTVGWLNGLKTLARHYRIKGVENIDFQTMETTILPYGGCRGAFSAGGDSGAAILDRNGRFAALLTGSGGLNGETDITFATPAYELMPRIKKAVLGADLFPKVPRY